MADEEENQGPPLDQSALDNIRALTSSVLARVINIYLKDSPDQLSALQDAIQVADAENMAKIAHRFKSGSANLGASKLADMCRTMESMGRENTTHGAEALLEQMNAEYKRVEAALKQELEQVA
jgi:HPt (histidine-containing phosphotransfer) domain-containing protein